MSLPDLLTETDFLAREFPSPGNPMRPLAVITPNPGEDAGNVARLVDELARRGYGGLVLDPAGFGPEFLTPAWLNLIGFYIEACRLGGLFLWLLDGITTGSVLDGILQRQTPAPQSPAIATRSFPVSNQGRLDFDIEGPEGGRLVGLLAWATDSAVPPINLLTRLNDLHLLWDPPPGKWEIVSFWAHELPGLSMPAFNWTDGAMVSSWLRTAFRPYQESFGSHLGRTVQGFLVFCPSWPKRKRVGEELVVPMLAGVDPSWLDLASLVSSVHGAGKGRSYFAHYVESVRQAYLTPLRDWCWRNRLRIAGYRLGGIPFPAMTGDFDLGGLPDLTPTAEPDQVEMAALAGVARYYRQERVATQLILSGEPDRDRAAVGRLAAAGADLFLVRRPAEYSLDCELALTDYAARVAMTVAAGGPLDALTLSIGDEPAAVDKVGQEALALGKKGVETICLPDSEAVCIEEVEGTPGNVLREADPHTAPDRELHLPPELTMRGRKVDAWSVYTFVSLSDQRWRGPVDLPVNGAAEIWHPSTGERRTIAPLATSPLLRVPLALESGEAVQVIVKGQGKPEFSTQSQLITAHLTMARRWEFEATGGNVLPLTWQDQTPGNWVTTFATLYVPDDLRLEGRPPGSAVWCNGALVLGDERAARVAPHARVGTNRLEIRGARNVPTAQIRGSFVCRGQAIDRPSAELAGPWTLNGYPHFGGPGIYRQVVHVPAELARAGLVSWMEISALSDSAAIRLNGKLVGYLPWPPYRLDFGPADVFKEGENLLDVEVSTPPGKAAWSFKGLLGEVSILFAEVAADEQRDWGQSYADNGTTGAFGP